MTEYNPEEKAAPEVVADLEEMSQDERQAVAAAERQGKRRKSVLEAAGVDPDARTDAAGRVLNDWEVSPEDQAGGHAYSE